jgi:hypothetical protein
MKSRLLLVTTTMAINSGTITSLLVSSGSRYVRRWTAHHQSVMFAVVKIPRGGQNTRQLKLTRMVSKTNSSVPCFTNKPFYGGKTTSNVSHHIRHNYYLRIKSFHHHFHHPMTPHHRQWIVIEEMIIVVASLDQYI